MSPSRPAIVTAWVSDPDVALELPLGLPAPLEFAAPGVDAPGTLAVTDDETVLGASEEAAVYMAADV
jgi:hypothetical protein